MAGSTYIKRNTDSGLTNTGGDTGEATEFVKLMNKGTAANTDVTGSVATNSTEKFKWITPSNIPGNLDWADGTYTWRWNNRAIQVNGEIVEVILRRLSSDGATVRASKSSGAITLVTFATTGVKSGTIDWNDDTQNPASRTVSDRLEVVFRIRNTSVLSAQTMTVGTNVLADDAISSPIVYERAPTEAAVTVSDIVAKLRRRKGIVANTVIVGADTTTTFAKKFRTVANTVTQSEAIARKKTAYRTETEPTITVSDTVATFAKKFRTIANTVTVGADVVSRFAKKFRSIANTVTLSETVAPKSKKYRTLAETTTVSDTPIRTALRRRTIANTVTVGADTVTKFARKFRSISQTVTVSDTVARVRAAVRAVTESIGGGGGGGGINRFYVIINETIPIADTVSRTVRKFRSISEPAITTDDTVNKSALRKVAVSEPAISVDDSTDRHALKKRVITEPEINASDTVTRKKTIVRAVIESAVSIGDSVVRKVIRHIDIREYVAVIDLVTRRKGTEEVEPFYTFPKKKRKFVKETNVWKIKLGRKYNENDVGIGSGEKTTT